MQKEALSVVTVKTLLAVLLFAGLGTIIVGGGYIIGEYSKTQNNKIVKPVDQETENYYNLLEEKCNGDNCCVSSLKTMRANNYKEADKNGKCPVGFFINMMKCIASYQWCEPMEEANWRNCNENSDCVETQADCCGCGNGGEQIGINKKYLKDWEDVLKDKCQDIGCITLFNCKEGEVVCEDNKCEFKEEIETNNFDTSNWQTYRNEEFGFEVKYPEYYSRPISDFKTMTEEDYDSIHFFRDMSEEELNDFKKHYATTFEEGSTYSGTVLVKSYNNEEELKRWYKIESFKNLEFKKFENVDYYIANKLTQQSIIGYNYIISHREIDSLFLVFEIPEFLKSKFEKDFLSSFKFIEN